MWETLDPETLNPKPRRRVSEIWGSCQDYIGIDLRTAPPDAVDTVAFRDPAGPQQPFLWELLCNSMLSDVVLWSKERSGRA